jgi:hypothetical protein
VSEADLFRHLCPGGRALVLPSHKRNEKQVLWAAQTRSVLRVRNMVEIVLGALVVIGVFVFWCDVTDSWNNVFLWNKTGKH